MDGFKSTYYDIFAHRADHLLIIGVPVNDAFLAAATGVYYDPYHRSQLRLHGYHSLLDVLALCEDIGLHQFILDWSAADDARRRVRANAANPGCANS